MSSTSAAVTLPKHERIFTTHMLLQFVMSNNGPPFPGHDFYNFMKELGITHRPSTPLYLQENSEAGCFKKSLGKSIGAAHNENKNWRRATYKLLLTYSATPHSATGHSLADLLYNRKTRTKLLQLVTESKPPTPLHEHDKEKDSQVKAKMKETADLERGAKYSDINVGDFVLVPQTKKNKLSTKYNPMQHRVTRGKVAELLHLQMVITQHEMLFFKKLSNGLRKDKNLRQEGLESKYNYFEKEAAEALEE